jgi:ABC-type nitrate/sulfonate/bicarbonate transport system substrate-binding protein
MQRKISRRTLLIGAASSASLLRSVFSATSVASAPLPIHIANASGGLNQTLTALMRSMRFLESFGLDPTILNVADGSKMVGAVLNGSVDASLMSGFGQIFPAIEHGASLKIVAGGTLTPTIALFTGQSDINSLKDLEGRTVGTGSVGALIYQLVVTLLKKYDVDVSKVRFVNVGSSADVFRAVSMRTIDAGPAASALISQAERYHVRLIPHGNMSAELRGYTFQGAWTSDRKIATNRDALVRALAAQAKLYRFVQTPQAKDAFIAARKSVFPGADPSDHEAEWDFIATYQPFDVDLALAPKQLDYIQQLNVSFNVQSQILPFDHVADMSLATDALKLLQRSG